MAVGKRRVPRQKSFTGHGGRAEPKVCAVPLCLVVYSVAMCACPPVLSIKPHWLNLSLGNFVLVSPTPTEQQTSGNHQATSTLAKPTLSSQGSIFTPHPTPPPSSQPVRNLVDPAWTLPSHSASDGLPAPRRPRRARRVGVHNTPRLQICTVVILWFDVIKRALRGGRRGGRVDAKRCREAAL